MSRAQLRGRVLAVAEMTQQGASAYEDPRLELGRAGTALPVANYYNRR